MSEPSAPPPDPPAAGTPPPPPFAPPPAPPLATQQYGYGYGPTSMPPLTSKGKRFGAYLLEILLVVVTLFIGWLVWSIVVWNRGQTPAKSILKMRVVKADTGQVADIGTMAVRELVGKVLLGLVPLYGLISAVFVLTDQRSQGLWDKIAGTVVVEDPTGALAPA